MTDVVPIVAAAALGLVLGALSHLICLRKWGTVSEQEQAAEYRTRNIIAILLTVGFLATIAAILMGMVDLHDSTSAAFAGVMLGYISGVLTPVLGKLFKLQNTPRGVDTDDDL